MHSQKADILQMMLTKEQQDLQVCLWYKEVVIFITLFLIEIIIYYSILPTSEYVNNSWSALYHDSTSYLYTFDRFWPVTMSKDDQISLNILFHVWLMSASLSFGIYLC